jgi:hypothetical protein
VLRGFLLGFYSWGGRRRRCSSLVGGIVRRIVSVLVGGFVSRI